MTTLPNPSRIHLVRSPCEKRAKSVRFVQGVWGAVWMSASIALVVAGCAVKSTAPVETVFNEPVEVKLPTTQIAAAQEATSKAEAASNEAIKAVDEITRENIEQSKPIAVKWTRETHEKIRAIYDPLVEARSINEIAAEKIIEARGQTEDARSRLKASEVARANERAEAQRQIKAANKRADRAEAWLPRVVSGLSILVGVGLIGVGVYSFLAVKTKLNGTALILTGAAMLGVGSALWWFGWIIGLIGLVALSVWTGFLIYLQIHRQRSQAIQTAKTLEALKANGKVTMDDAAIKTANAIQTDPATKALVDVVTDKAGK